jgi:hypothetical protein
MPGIERRDALKVVGAAAVVTALSSAAAPARSADDKKEAPKLHGGVNMRAASLTTVIGRVTSINAGLGQCNFGLNVNGTVQPFGYPPGQIDQAGVAIVTLAYMKSANLGVIYDSNAPGVVVAVGIGS